MPKWRVHREVAQILNIKLPENLMREIDGDIDGLKKGFIHDFWRSSINEFNRYLDKVARQYGREAVKYALLHVFLDLAKELIISEKSRDKTPIEHATQFIEEFMMQYRYILSMAGLKVSLCSEALSKALEGVRSVIVKDHIIRIWRELSKEIKMKCYLLNSLLNNLDEVKKAVANLENLKFISKCASKITKIYAMKYSLNFVEKDILRKLILKFWSRKVNQTSKDEILEDIKYELSKGLQKEYVEKILKILKEILNKYPKPLPYCRQIINLFNGI